MQSQSDNQLSAEPSGSQWQETGWWSEPGREEYQWMCLWELRSRILGPSEGLWRTLQGTWGSTSFMLFLRHLSSFVLRVCMSPFGLQSIFRCHKKTVSHSWCSWDGGELGCCVLPSVLPAPSPVTDSKAWSTSQNILAWEAHLWCYIQIHLFIIPFKVGKVILFSIFK